MKTIVVKVYELEDDKTEKLIQHSKIPLATNTPRNIQLFCANLAHYITKRGQL